MNKLLSLLVLFSSLACAFPSLAVPAVMVGAKVLDKSEYAELHCKNVGLITNNTSIVDGVHLADMMRACGKVRVAALFAPEHGLRGVREDGIRFTRRLDEQTGVPVYSLYGRVKKPTSEMLHGLDFLVFDIQDIGARFYTFISTMGLAMQAAAEAHIPFVVLDRPNPLGGEYFDGPVLERGCRSFTGEYPIPVAHGLTVGELALMI